MRGKRFQTVSITLLFSVVLMCCVIFAVLTVVTACTDAKLAERYGETVKEQYACESMGQEWLSAVDGWLEGKNDLPDGTKLSADTVKAELTHGRHVLTIELGLTETGYEIRQRRCSVNWEPAEKWSLWQGAD